jgi:nucleotide-binding universal stress UspA family protein
MGTQNVLLKIPYRKPIGEIRNELIDGYCNLVVMGSQGRCFIQEIFLGSTSQSIAGDAPISVLLVSALR